MLTNTAVPAPGMDHEQHFWLRATAQAARWRWQIAALMAILAVAIDAAIYVVEELGEIGVTAATGFFVHIVVFPLLVAFSLALLERYRVLAAEFRRQDVHNEQLRIAREIHDSLAQKLAYVNLQLDAITAQAYGLDDPSLGASLGRVREVTGDAYEEVRGTLVALRLPEQGDLANALRSTAQVVMARSGLHIEVSSRGLPLPLPDAVSRRVMHICREALANAEKHARAGHVDIVLQWSGALLTVTVSDDGCGFDPAAGSKPGHFGLALMQEHAHEVGGSLAIMSQPRAGTAVILHVPVVSAEPAAGAHGREPRRLGPFSKGRADAHTPR